jgi:hypothetical protein
VVGRTQCGDPPGLGCLVLAVVRVTAGRARAAAGCYAAATATAAAGGGPAQGSDPILLAVAWLWVWGHRHRSSCDRTGSRQAAARSAAALVETLFRHAMHDGRLICLTR